jgi:hypothetical protein
MFPGLPRLSIFMTNRSVPLPEVLNTVSRCFRDRLLGVSCALQIDRSVCQFMTRRTLLGPTVRIKIACYLCWHPRQAAEGCLLTRPHAVFPPRSDCWCSSWGRPASTTSSRAMATPSALRRVLSS